jgi:hypothetical protein
VLGVGLPHPEPQAQPGAVLLAQLDQRINAHLIRGAATRFRTDEPPGSAANENGQVPGRPDNEPA